MLIIYYSSKYGQNEAEGEKLSEKAMCRYSEVEEVVTGRRRGAASLTIKVEIKKEKKRANDGIQENGSARFKNSLQTL